MADAVDVREGDVWEYGEVPDAPSLSGKKRRIIGSTRGTLYAVDDAGDVRSSDMQFLASRARLVSRQGVEPYLSDAYLYGLPKAADRSGCKPWCGGPYYDERVPVSTGGESFIALVGGGFEAWYRQPAWCSALCRDEQRGPLTSPAPVVQAEAPKPVAAQPKCIVCGTGADNWRHVPSAVFGGRPAHEFVTTVRANGGLLRPYQRRVLNETLCSVHSIPACEMGPSAVASAPTRQRDTFADLCSEWDLLPDVR